MKGKKPYFSPFEKLLWSGSAVLIAVSFFAFDRVRYETLIASLIGITSLILCAKGNPWGQVLMVAFSLLYGVISFACRYYGEMITYLGMTMPMAILSLVAWLRHPYRGNRSEVEVNALRGREAVWVALATVAVTAVFYGILKACHTARLLPSTLSVATSFLAVSLTFLRSPYFALAYALNDLVLILLWSLASQSESRYLSVVVCFVAFFVNDLYGFVSWRRMQRRQSADAPRAPEEKIRKKDLN